MFKCQKCGKLLPPRQPTNRVVTEKRQRQYEQVIDTGKLRGTVEYITGWEIVKELIVCPECYVLSTGLQPRVVEVRKTRSPVHTKHGFKESTYQRPRKKQSTRDDNDIGTSNKFRQRSHPIVEKVNHIPLVKE